MVATNPHPHAVANIKLRLALNTADSWHAQITDDLARGNPHPDAHALLVNGYVAIHAYTQALVDQLTQAGGIMPADAPALFEPAAIQAAEAAVQREIMPYLEAAASQETRFPVQPGKEGKAWTEQIRGGGPAPSRHC
jgi:hypothetical protein